MNLGEFFNMGGYAVYVWGSYAVATLILGMNILQARRRLQQAARRAKQS